MYTHTRTDIRRKKTMTRTLFALAIIATTTCIAHAQTDSVPCIYSDFVSFTDGIVEGDQIEIDGEFAYIGNGGRGLKIYNIADPAAPILVGEHPTSSRILSFAKQGDTVALAVQRDHVLFLDVSDPSTPTYLGETDDMPRPLGVEFIDGRLFVTEEFEGLAIYDVTSPKAPTRISTFPIARAQQDITEHNGLVYIAAGRDGIYILDAQDPLQPTLISTIPSDNHTLRFEPEGDLLYRTDESAGLSIFDISNPLMPQLLSNVPAEDAGFSGVGLEVVDGRVLIADYQFGTRIIDCTDPTSPQFMGFYDTGDDTWDVTFHDGLAYVVSKNRGLQVLDVSSPKLQPTIAQHKTPGWVYDVDIADDTLYVVDGNTSTRRFGTGLQILDVSNPQSPVQIGNVPGPEYPLSMLAVRFHDGLTYLCNGQSGLSIVDVQDPATPAQLGSITGITATDVLLNENHAYITTPDGLEIADVSVPSQPAIIATIELQSPVNSIAIEGNTAYLASSGIGVLVYDISDPASPTQIAIYETPDFAAHLDVIDGIVYLNDYASFLIVDLNDPTNPIMLAQYPWYFSDGEVRVIDDTAYVTSGRYSFLMFDVSDPTNPIRTGLYQAPGEFRTSRSESMLIRDGVAYVANTRAGVLVVDVSPECSEPCSADFNDDGELNFFDVSAFLAAYLGSNTAADLNDDGQFNFFDVSAFLVAYNAGCP